MNSQSTKLILIIAISASAAAGATFLLTGSQLGTSVLPSQPAESADSSNVQDIAVPEEPQAQLQNIQSSALECQAIKSADSGFADVSAKLVEKTSGKGIADKPLLLVVMPGNPIAESLTDNTGEARVSVDLSEFEDSQSVFIFFDGDDKYDFTSCEIQVEST